MSSLVLGLLKLERLGSTVTVYTATGWHVITMTASEWKSLELAVASLSVAERRAEADRQEIARLTKERDEARKHLDERIQWQLEAVLNLQTFRALFDAAVAMRENREGCLAEPACGECVRCKFDKAVDQATVEVNAGVDRFIAESAGFWGRFAARMQNERDAALARFVPLSSVLRNWDWQAIIADGYWRHDYERAIEQVVQAMAEVERSGEEQL